MDFNLSMGAFSQDKNFVPLQQENIYDILILGGGPAGLTAAVYCMRKGMNTGIIIKDIGGQVAETTGVENYPGFSYISGTELVDKFSQQVQEFTIGFEEGVSVKSIEDGKIKKVNVDDGRVFSARALIITTGKRSRRLNVPGEQEFAGHGVAYCATCDAPFFAGKKVAVAGGGNSAVEAAIDLARVASAVTVVQFTGELTADKILRDKLAQFSNVTVIYSHEITEIKGDAGVTSVTARDRESGSSVDIDAAGIFVEIGLIPNTEFASAVLSMNRAGEIEIDCACHTSAPGIFAAGDATTVPYKQIIIAGGEGAKAALSACDYILKET